MQLEKLQINLRPRSNAAALDLGLVLLRAHALGVYKVWLALWLPMMALTSALCYFYPEQIWLWILGSWWLRPFFERAPLYVLSRQVFGEDVSLADALRAWPRQLGGGWFRLLTWWRPFMPGRGLYQAVWQLENARGQMAADRINVIGGGKAGASAYWFGVICAHFEVVLQIGLLSLVGLFFNQGSIANPFAFLFGKYGVPNTTLIAAFEVICYAFSSSIMGPIYIACCFTLYLNRRASLEAWDLEISLRQIAQAVQRKSTESLRTAAALMLAPVVLALVILQPETARAVTETIKCPPPAYSEQMKPTQSPVRTPDQAALRADLTKIYDSDDMRSYTCVETWQKKNPYKKVKEESLQLPEKFELLAQIVKVLLIATAVGVVGWLLYVYRDSFPTFKRDEVEVATEVGGLDIRAESLPEDVAASVRDLWARGERRAALALLYRATLVRLIHEDALVIRKGATEGDCLRLAQQARQRDTLSQARYDVTATTTSQWLAAAYGDRWPDDALLNDSCSRWNEQFGKTKARPV